MIMQSIMILENNIDHLKYPVDKDLLGSKWILKDYKAIFSRKAQPLISRVRLEEKYKIQVKDLEEKSQDRNKLLQESRDVLMKNYEYTKDLLKFFCKKE